jgi:carboxylesterase
MNTDQSLEEILSRRGGFVLEADSDTAVFFIHGIGGNASGLYPLANYVHEHNHLTAEGVCLPGHAGQPEDLLKVNEKDWVKKAETEYLQLQKRYTHVYLGGMSLGSLVCLAIAERYPVDGLILMSCPLEYKYWAIHLSPLISLFKRYHVWKDFVSGLDPEKAKVVCYSKIPYRSITQMSRLQKRVRSSLSQINCPVLALYGKRDGLVSPQCGAMLQKGLKKPAKLVYFPASGHGLLYGSENEAVFQEISRFLPSGN